MNNNLFAVAPNKRAFDHAIRMELIPVDCKYIHSPENIRGVYESTVYIVNYTYRQGNIWAWGSMESDRRREEMLACIETSKADIKHVRLP